MAGVHELPQLRQLVIQRRISIAHVSEVRHALLLAIHVQRTVAQLELACGGARLVVWLGGLSLHLEGWQAGAG